MRKLKDIRRQAGDAGAGDATVANDDEAYQDRENDNGERVPEPIVGMWPPVHSDQEGSAGGDERREGMYEEAMASSMIWAVGCQWKSLGNAMFLEAQRGISRCNSMLQTVQSIQIAQKPMSLRCMSKAISKLIVIDSARISAISGDDHLSGSPLVLILSFSLNRSFGATSWVTYKDKRGVG